MNTQPEQLENLQRRLERLERQNRRLRRLGFAAAAVLAVVLLSGQAAPMPTELSAEGFRLYDADGKVRGEFVMGKEGPLLRLLDVEGRPQAALSGGKQTALTLFDAAGNARASTAVSPQEVGLSLFDEKGMPQAKVGVVGMRSALDLFEQGKHRVAVGVADGDAAAALLSAEGVPQALMSAGKDSTGKNTAAYALRDPKGNPQFVVTARKEGTMVSLFDISEGASVSRLTITANEAGTGYFIKDDKGKVRVQLQMSEGKPQFGLFDENGNDLFSKP